MVKITIPASTIGGRWAVSDPDVDCWRCRSGQDRSVLCGGCVKELAIERQQVEWVFGLTGGELADEVWANMTEGRYSDGEGTGDFYTFGDRYWYEGVPDYMEKGQYDFWGQQRTVLAFGGGYMDAPDPVIWDGEGEWKLIATFNSSGESPCPYRDYDPIGQVDHQGMDPRKVGRREAKLVDQPWVRVAGGGGRTEKRPGHKIGECPYCEERVGEEHGYIYIGEGYEAVYELVVVDHYEVLVGNIGTVHRVENEEEAKSCFDAYVEKSKAGDGRAAGEEVSLFKNDELVKDYVPAEEDEEAASSSSCCCPLVWGGHGEPKPDPKRVDEECPVHAKEVDDGQRD